jgi:hypothetical protein
MVDYSKVNQCYLARQIEERKQASYKSKQKE